MSVCDRYDRDGWVYWRELFVLSDLDGIKFVLDLEGGRENDDCDMGMVYFLFFIR